MSAKRLPAYTFVIEELAESRVAPLLRTRPMFGAHSVYVGEKIVFILRRKDDAVTVRDNGVWVAMAPEHTPFFRQTFSEARPIEMFQARGREGFSGWVNLPENEEGFEEAVLRVCRMVIDGDPRIGKIPKSKARKRS